jgi:hypothetical protein
MVEIAESIKRCTRLCDSYYKRHLASTYNLLSARYDLTLARVVRILTSVKWQSRVSN